MNQLLPIVRRQRRPLLVVESEPDRPPRPPAMAGNVEPVNVEANAEGVVRSEESKPSEHASAESSE